MPNDMTIPAVQAIASLPDPRNDRSTRSSSAEPRPATPGPYVNPTLRLDTDVGLVVMEFRDDAGTVTTIPSERQLAAYRAHQDAESRVKPPPTSSDAPAPDGDHAPAVRDAERQNGTVPGLGDTAASAATQTRVAHAGIPIPAPVQAEIRQPPTVSASIRRTDTGDPRADAAISPPVNATPPPDPGPEHA